MDGAGADYGAIDLRHTDHGTIVNNEIYNTDTHGISLWWGCDENTIVGNRIYENSKSGIAMYYDCDDNNIQLNYIANNTQYGIYSIGDDGASNDDFNERNIIARNIIDGNNSQSRGLYFHNGHLNNSVLFNVVTNNVDGGIGFYNNANNNTIFRNVVSNTTGYGIKMERNCSDNTIRKNIIANNTLGLLIADSISTIAVDNDIFQNAFINNDVHATDNTNNGDNNWNATIVGNYWDNHTSPDTTPKNGIVDVPYEYIMGTANAEDGKPIAGDPVHHGAEIHIDEEGTGNFTWAQASLLTIWCYGDGTESNPFTIEGLDINAGGTGSCLEIGNSSVYITIKDCNFTNSGDNPYAGIKLYNTHNATIIGNNFTYCYAGILLEYSSSDNTISGNNFIDNTDSGILFDGTLGSCHNNTISGNFLDKNAPFGIVLFLCDDNIISGNIVNDSGADGIYLEGSEENNITGNLITNNGVYGIEMLDTGCIDNIIWENAFIGNGIHAYDESANNNFWNNTNNGNYWDNYTGSERAEGDNIGDIPYEFIKRVNSGVKDHLPIFQLLVNVTVLNPINSTVFGANAPDFKVEIGFIVEALDVDKMWYSIYNGITWSDEFLFTVNGTIDQDSWSEMPQNKEIVVRFYANDTLGNEGYTDINVTRILPPSGGGGLLPAADDDDDDDDDARGIPGYDVYLFLLAISLISFLIVLERRKRIKI